MTNTSTPFIPVIEGGPSDAVIQAPKAGLRWGQEELKQLEQMLQQPSLFYWKGPQTNLMIERFKQIYPLEWVMGCSSGTAAIHIAVAAAGIGPGDEVIVPPITDMGTLIGILYQQGVPVFADVEPNTYNLDVQSVREKITSKTKAIIYVHLAGNPSGVDEIQKLAREKGLILIEDAAQAWGAELDGKPVGSFGDIACYSLNDFKHIGAGDGGIVASSDPRFGPLLQKHGDKAYDRVSGGRGSDVLAPNYRISEPQSAVAAAQMLRVKDIAVKRNALGNRLSELLEGIPGIAPHKVAPNAYSSYWFYLWRFDASYFKCDRTQFAQAMAAEGLLAHAGYIPKPVYQYPMFANENFFAGRWPVKELGLTDMDYKKVSCPVAEQVLETCVNMILREFLTEEYIEAAGQTIRKLAEYYAK